MTHLEDQHPEKYLDVLHQVFGIKELKKEQKSLVECVIKGENAIGILPTGFGKSLCYQLPAVIAHKNVLIISPLVALIDNQIQGLKEKGLNAVSLEGFKHLEYLIHKKKGSKNTPFFLFASPERITQHLILNQLIKLNIDLIVIDEAHCISSWGPSFRPSFLKLHLLSEKLPDASWLLLTATLDQFSIQNIQKNLKLSKWKEIFKSPIKTNQSIFVKSTENPQHSLLEILEKHPKSAGIIYVSSIIQCERLSALLNQNGVKSDYFHSKRSLQEKATSINNWQSSNYIMVATSAFGMGIHKSNVVFVLFYGLPNSIEDLFQGFGRAGRKIKDSFVYVLYRHTHLDQLYQKAYERFPSTGELSRIYKKIDTEYPSKENVLHYDSFAKKHSLSISSLQKAIALLEQHHILSLLASEHKEMYVKIRATQNQIDALLTHKPNIEPLMTFLLRNHPQIRFKHTKIVAKDVKKYESVFGPIPQKKNMFNYLKNSRYIDIQYLDKDHSRIIKHKTRSEALKIIQNSTLNLRKRRIKYELDSLKKWLTTTECRNKIAANYFGFKQQNHCLVCDNCKATNHSSLSLSEQILEILKHETHIEIQQLIGRLNSPKEHSIIEVIRWLKDQHLIVENNLILSLKEPKK